MQAGTVVYINPRRGMFIIGLNDGDYTVWKILDGFELVLGGRIQGDLQSLGSETLLDLRSGEQFIAHGQASPSSLTAALAVVI